jgi:hypothetical protein
MLIERRLGCTFSRGIVVDPPQASPQATSPKALRRLQNTRGTVIVFSLCFRIAPERSQKG